MFVETDFRDMHVGGMIRLPWNYHEFTAGTQFKITTIPSDSQFIYVKSLNGQSAFAIWAYEWDWTLPYRESK